MPALLNKLHFIAGLWWSISTLHTPIFKRRQRLILVCMFAAFFSLAACSKKLAVSAPNDVQGQVAKAGNSLAYEHTLRILIAADAMHARVVAARLACEDARFGACSVLRIEEDAGSYPSASLKLRIVPAGVEPLVNLAARDASVGSRETKAEDLAEAVADTARNTEMLTRQRLKLSEFETRKDLSVADMLTLSRESASVEIQLDALTKTAQQQQRRIETNLLTLNFRADREASHWSRIGDAFSGSFDQMTEGVVTVIESIGFGLPLLLVAFPLALLWRWLWRRATRRRDA